MRTSVYIPDELWEQVREANPTRNVSELMQTGLRKLIEERGVPDFAKELPSTDPAEMGRIRERLLAGARKMYELGYQHGLEIASRLDWWMLDSLARDNWDVRRWLRSTNIQSKTSAGEEISVPLDIWLGFEELALDDTALGLGFVHAVKQVWEGVVRSTEKQSQGQASEGLVQSGS